jgi:hypothetical protein
VGEAGHAEEELALPDAELAFQLKLRFFLVVFKVDKREFPPPSSLSLSLSPKSLSLSLKKTKTINLKLTHSSVDPALVLGHCQEVGGPGVDVAHPAVDLGVDACGER